MNVKIERIGLNACCMLNTENGMWFVHGMAPFLCFYAYEQDKVTVARIINIDAGYGTAYFSVMYKQDDDLIMVPNNSRYLVIYNIRTGRFYRSKIKNAVNNLYKGAYEYNGKLYCVPYRANEMLCVNLENYTMNYVNIYSNGMEKHCLNSNCRVGNMIYCVEWNTNTIIIIDLESEKIYSKETEEICSFESVTYNGDSLYLFDIHSKSVLKFGLDRLETEERIYTGLDSAELWTLPNGCVVVDSTNSYYMAMIGENGLKKVDYKELRRDGSILIDHTMWKMCCWSSNTNGRIKFITPDGVIIVYEEGRYNIRRLVIDKKIYNRLTEELQRNCKNNAGLERNSYSLKGFIENVLRGGLENDR